MLYVRLAVVAIFSGIAAYSDFKTQKIRNKLTVSLALIGLLSAMLFDGVDISSSLLGMVVPFIICLPFYCLKILRAGDIKLYMAIGSVMGLHWICLCMVYSVIASGIFALIVAIKRRCLLRRISYLFGYIKSIFYMNTIRPYMDEDKNSEGYFPYGIGIFAGAVICIIESVMNLTA